MKVKFLAVMFMCFIVGGYLLLNFSSQVFVVYSSAGTALNGNPNFTDRMMLFNETGLNGTPFFRRGPIDRTFSPEIFIDLVAGTMFVIAGLTIWHLIREEEMGELEDRMTDMLLLPEEKMIIGELRKAGGEMTQKELTSKTGLSKVKIHRVLGKLESKKVIKRHPYGMTRKIVIERSHGSS